MLGDHGLKKLPASGKRFGRLRTALIGFAVVVLGTAALGLTLLYFAPTILGWFAPKLDLSKDDLYTANRPIAFTFVDADGDTVGHRGAIVGDRLTLEEMPPYLPAAFIAMEDRSFYQNEGLDVRGLLRALWVNFRAGHVVQGGSTITQQTAKIVFLNPKRTYSRKLEELLDAAALAESLTKQQILEVYLNRIYLGAGAYGVDGAARVYFGKSARNVSLAEAAMLATLTRAPSANSPRHDLAAAQSRTNLVLDAMVETGAITPAQAVEAHAHPAAVSSARLADARNFFLDTAADEALRDVNAESGPPTSDLIVHTTLIPRLQESARRAVSHTLAMRGRKLHASEAAVVLMKTDGAVTALLGGRDYDSSSFNRATQAERQPGSAFKPFVYLAAVEDGDSPWDQRNDGPVDIDGWTPTNYGGRSYGTVTLADALAHSINTVTATLAQEVGVTSVIDAAHRCGIVSKLEPNASLALGTSEVTPFELTTAYATFAAGGERVYPYFVTEVDDSAHHVLFRRNPPVAQRVVASHVDRDMVAMLADVLTEGTGRAAALSGHEAAGKTGTTQDYHDAWFVGFTTDYVAGVWVGNDDSSPMRGVTGGSLPAAIWKQVMTAAELGLPGRPLDRSVPETSTDEETVADTGDDESDSAPTTSSAPGTAENASPESAQQQQQAPAQPSFWNWMFGNGQPAPERSPGFAQAGQAQDNQQQQAVQSTQLPPPQSRSQSDPPSSPDAAQLPSRHPRGNGSGYGAPPPPPPGPPPPPPPEVTDQGGPDENAPPPGDAGGN
jgi:penicillin-binding protein 1A